MYTFLWGSLSFSICMCAGMYTHTHTHTHPHGASLVIQMVKNPPAVQETWVWSLGWEDLLEEGMANHSSILARRIAMDREAQWATMGSQSQIWLSDFHFTIVNSACYPIFVMKRFILSISLLYWFLGYNIVLFTIANKGEMTNNIKRLKKW